MTDQRSGSGARLIAGAIVILAGALLSMTGIGVIFGIPLMMLGFAVMFPRFTAAMIVLAILAFILLLLAI